MPDWRALTEQRLAGLRLPDPRREQILQELAEHLEDEFILLRQRFPEDEAQRRTLSLLAEPDTLIREIGKAEREDTMTQAARTFLCGILTGGISFLLGVMVFIFALGNTAFASAIDAAGPPAFPPLLWLLHLAGGIWTMWLYAAIRPRYGAGPKTAAVAGFAMWVICTLADMRWVSIGAVPVSLTSFLAPLSFGIPVAVLATMAGAWAFERSERAPSPALKVS